MSITLSDLRTSITAWLNETPDNARIDNAVNDAITELWQVIIQIDPGKYLSRKPDKLTDPTDIMPFEELGAEPFIEHSAVGHIYLSWYEYDAAKYWDAKARGSGDTDEGHLGKIKQQVLTELDRQESIEAYQPLVTLTQQVFKG
jgi:hypothetical protein